VCCGVSLNGVPACANKRLLREILRDEWNFTGYVVSDDDALENMISRHHYVDDAVTAAAAAIKAGCNLELADAKNVVYHSIPQVCLRCLQFSALMLFFWALRSRLHSRSFEMASFDRLCTSCQVLLAFHCNYGPILYHF